MPEILRYPENIDANVNPLIHFKPYIYNVSFPNITDLQPPEKIESTKFGNIFMYMPGEFSEKISADWGYEDVMQGGGGGYGALLTNNIKTLLDEKLKDSKILRSISVGTNTFPYPSDINIFKGLNPLSFDIHFNMIPYSKEESEVISNICYTFKMAIMPSVKSGILNNVFLTFPETWDIRVINLYGTGLDTTSSLASTLYEDMCLTSCDVSYISDSETMATFDSHYPIGVKLSLSFTSLRKYFNKA